MLQYAALLNFSIYLTSLSACKQDRILAPSKQTPFSRPGYCVCNQAQNVSRLNLFFLIPTGRSHWSSISPLKSERAYNLEIFECVCSCSVIHLFQGHSPSVVFCICVLEASTLFIFTFRCDTYKRFCILFPIVKIFLLYCVSLRTRFIIWTFRQRLHDC